MGCVALGTCQSRSGKWEVRCSNDVSYGASCEFQIFFTKLRPAALEVQDLPKNVTVSSMSHSPISSLYHSLKNIYTPLLKQGPGGTGGSDTAQLHSRVAELEAGLSTTLRRSAAAMDADGSWRREMVRQAESDEQDGGSATANLGPILTPTDEFQLWAELAVRDMPCIPARRSRHHCNLTGHAWDDPG